MCAFPSRMFGAMPREGDRKGRHGELEGMLNSGDRPNASPGEKYQNEAPGTEKTKKEFLQHHGDKGQADIAPGHFSTDSDS